MAINKFSSLCASDCNTVVQMPAIDADQNCTGFETYLSQIGDLFIKPDSANGTPFAGWVNGTLSVITAESANVDNSNTDNTKCKHLVGIGGVPSPDKSTQVLPKFKSKITKRLYTFTFTIPNVSDANYEFGRALQCGDTNFTFWYGNESHTFGSAEGIRPKSVDADFPKEEGEDAIEQIVCTIQFEAKVDPERRNNPYS